VIKGINIATHLNIPFLSMIYFKNGKGGEK